MHADLQRVSADETITAMLAIVTVGVAERRAQRRRRDGRHHARDRDRGPRGQDSRSTSRSTSRELGIHQHVSAGEIPLPDGFRLVTSPDTVVVAIEASRTAKDLEEAAAPAEEAPSRRSSAPPHRRAPAGRTITRLVVGLGNPGSEYAGPATTSGSW